MYNVIEKLRGQHELSAKERTTHEHGLLSVLLQLHDELDAAVATAYALPDDADDATILTHLCHLNAQRAAEEQRGHIRWLRPEFQGAGVSPPPAETTGDLDLPEGAEPSPAALRPSRAKHLWPKPLPERVRLIATTLATAARPLRTEEVTALFKSAKPADVEEILDTLVTLGRARCEDELYAVK